MIFRETRLAGAWIVDLERREDERGFFARVWCQREFEAHGLTARVAQANTSCSRAPGSLRGMHYQLPPHAEAKTVRCTHGAVFDVIIDLRPHSPTCGDWLGVELSAENGRMLYVPEGFAHGFQTLTAEAEVTYMVSEFYTPAAEHGVRFDDPAFAIAWPIPVSCISAKDASWPDYAGPRARPGPAVERASRILEAVP